MNNRRNKLIRIIFILLFLYESYYFYNIFVMSYKIFKFVDMI